jgi:hypothetical protein
VNVTTVRTRYEHISHGWRRATADRRAALIGELELLSLQLPTASDDPGRNEIVALRADIMELIALITIGRSDAD